MSDPSSKPSLTHSHLATSTPLSKTKPRSPSTSTTRSRSSLLPPSFRSSSNATRKPSNPAPSLIFASPSSALPPRGRGVSASEAALSRQLDGDLGGRQMGLRSRTSSNATLRTERSTSGYGVGGGPKSPGSESVMEVDEEEDRRFEGEGEAGPSRRLPLGINGLDNGLPPSETLEDKESSERGSLRIRKLNPKTSSSWMRWNSPAPSFPKSMTPNKGKGKEKAGGPLAPSVNGEVNHDESLSHNTAPMDNPQLIPPKDVQIAEDEAKPTEPSIPSPSTTSTPQATVGRRWWSRGGEKKVDPAGELKGPQKEPTSAAVAAAAVSPKSGDVPPPPATQGADSSNNSIPTSKDPSTEPNTAKPLESSPNETNLQPSIGTGTVGRSWRSYIGLGGSATSAAVSTNPPPPTTSKLAQETIPAVAEPPPVPIPPLLPPVDLKTAVAARDGENGVPPIQPSETAPEAALSEPLILPNVSKSEESVNQTPQTSNNAGWGSYLYSFVVPQPKQAISSTMSPIPAPGPSDSTAVASEPAPSRSQPPSTPPPKTAVAVLPTEPTADQKPAPPPDPPTLTVESASPLPTPASQPVPQAETLTPRTASPSRKPQPQPGSQSSTAGWLNYLAFRANQKKIQSSSVASIKSTADPEGRKSTEIGEEVMDFSNDPDFPSGPAPIASGGADDKPKDKVVNKKASQNLEAKNKRLSISSLQSASASSTTPIPPSPKGRSSLDGDRTPASGGASIKTVASSALPPPPQPPSTQPNLIIPSFSTTFDRPPRCFLPVPPPPDPSSTKGIASATSGLAWRALGAMGNYVYGSETPKANPDTIQENEKELRGRKEGRNVGANLPRRIGLGSGSPDDGWKNVQRVVVVGVHGWFPAKMLNSVIGEPTGTSLKFANMMALAVKNFFEDRGMTNIRITIIPLEGEGTIDSRVDRLYKTYLSNPAWINDLRRADAIFFAAHSQGCIVTTHLISRLIAQGHIRTPLNGEAVARCEWAFGPIGIIPQEPSRGRGGKRDTSHPITGVSEGYQRVAMLAMCGVHLGPFYSINSSTVIQPYLQWFENAAARELFEFQDTNSAVSLAYQKALAMVLENQVKVVLLASLNDQVVPIYGGSFSNASHPLLLRALFVDGASYSASDFMTNLICFAFMLRNAGIDDQRLVEHLSEATAGSLTGVGHSSPYEHLPSYTLAVEYLFHSTTPTPLPPLTIEPFSAREGRNDFELPWIMRALVDSLEVKDLFPGELRELKDGIASWKPGTKALREIKRRLEPMAGRQSKLRPLATSPSSTSLLSDRENAIGALSSSPASGTGLGGPGQGQGGSATGGKGAGIASGAGGGVGVAAQGSGKTKTKSRL